MSLHAGFFKRLFAFIIDLTLVIVVTYLLYLFPFQLIINNSIDKEYKKNVKIPYDEITETYSGSYSYFGQTEAGILEGLSTLHSSGFLTEDELNENRTNTSSVYTLVSQIANSLNENKLVPFDKELSYEDQFYSKVYQLYQYIDYAYAVKTNFPIDLTTYNHFSSLEERGDINSEKRAELENQYKEQVRNEYIEQLELLIKLLKDYESLNENLSIANTIAFKTIINKYSTNTKNKIESISGEFNDEDLAKVVAYVESFYNYQQTVTTVEYLGTDLKDGSQVVKFSDEAFYIFYYNHMNLEFNEQLPYYVQVYEHTNLSIVYSLSMFTLVFSIYTMVMRGRTLGRRCVKIQLTDGHEREKLNPIFALLHDVPFRFLYVLAFGLFSIVLALAAMILFTIIDIIMIRFTKDHRCIRDILSNTRVIEASNRY